MAASKNTVLQVSRITAKRVRDIKKTTGVSMVKLADRGLDFFCDALGRGEVIIQNGEVVEKSAAA